MGPDQWWYQEFAFHLREMRADLRAAATSLRSAADTAATGDSIVHLLDARSCVEHDLDHHLPALLALLPAALPAGVPGGTGAVSLAEPPATGNAPERAISAVRRAEEELDAFEGEHAGFAAAPTATSVPAAVERLRAALDLALVAIDLWYDRADDAASRADPARVEARRADEALSTPECELPLAGARTLVACPRCGLSLTGGDRTFDGSFCEACGTRWVDPRPDSATVE